ncbi:MAG TPA: sodium:proton antiporter [Nevskiaceae bacterium]
MKVGRLGRSALGALLLLALCAPTAHAAVPLPGADMPLWWGLPFAGLLLSIAVAPIIFARLWQRHYGKVALFWGLLTVVPLALFAGPMPATTAVLETVLLDYVPFLILIASLYTIAGGILVTGNLRGTPVTNTVLLIISTVLASFIGTTGAAMVMIRPLLRANRSRRFNAHVVVFFIFLACNIGGSLTPLGDPPLFVGFLRGVHFFWTTEHLFRESLTVAVILLILFFLIDRWFYRHETSEVRDGVAELTGAVGVRGLINLPLLAGVIGAVLLSAWWHPGVVFELLGVHLRLENLTRDVVMILMAVLSVVLSKHAYREANGFEWESILEVGKLFAAIFICLVPVAAMLQAGEQGPLGGLIRLVTNADGSGNSLMYFWLTGLLSSFLDNTPTYLVFFDVAGGDPQRLMTSGAAVLVAISAGAVFMGANTYIGNAPNFMVYAIARRQGVHMPHFFGYMAWSIVILIPVFALVGWLLIA